MKLCLHGIKEKESWENAGIRMPEYDVEEIVANTKKSPIWVHFGAGNIFRIFIGGIADKLIAEGEMNKGITCVESFDMEIIDKIYKPYDNLVLGVTLNADGSKEKQVIGSLTEALKASGDAEDEGRLKEIFCNPQLQMVSFTITEKGYTIKDSKGNFFPGIKEEVENGPEKVSSAMAILCKLLHERFVNGAAALAVVSMDNCSHNGEKLKNAVVSIAEEWEKRGFVEEEFISYLLNEAKISFPFSMIDKITPRPAEIVARELATIGVEEMDPITTKKRTFIAPFVNAESPEYLVIEDKFPNGRPRLEKAGVYMTDRIRVNKVERMKVTSCLNPLHTALAVYGCLLGYDLIAEEMKDEDLQKLVRRLGLVEGLEVVEDPEIISPQKFVQEVIEVRLPNPYMPDTPQRIATDTSQKVGIRFGETIKSYVEKYGDAKKLKAIPLAIAGWCRYLLGVDDKGNSFKISDDPMLEELTACLKGIKIGEPQSYQGQLRNILSNQGLFGMDLYPAGIGEQIEAMFMESIKAPGAVRELLQTLE